MVAGKVEILLLVGRFDVDRGVETKLVTFKKSNIGGRWREVCSR